MEHGIIQRDKNNDHEIDAHTPDDAITYAMPVLVPGFVRVLILDDLQYKSTF